MQEPPVVVPRRHSELQEGGFQSSANNADQNKGTFHAIDLISLIPSADFAQGHRNLTGIAETPATSFTNAQAKLPVSTSQEDDAISDPAYRKSIQSRENVETPSA